MYDSQCIYRGSSPWQVVPSPSLVLHLLTAPTHDGHLVALVTGRAEVIEAERVLAVAAGEMAGLDSQSGQCVVVTAPLTGGLGAWHIDGSFLDVVDEHHPVGHPMRHDRPAHEYPIGIDGFNPIIVAYFDFRGIARAHPHRRPTPRQ